MAIKKLTLNKAKSAATSGQNSSLIILMVAATLAVSLSVVFSRVWFKDIRFSNKVLAKKAVVVQTLEQNVAVLDSLKTNYGFLEKDGPKPADVLKALPVTPDYPALASQLETMAATEGAQVTSVIISPPPEGVLSSTYTPVSFNVNAGGSYQSLIKFIRNLEVSKRPTRLDKVAISGAADDLTLQLTFTTYYQPVTTVGNETEEFSDEN